ncbi:MAG: hydantoinase/oxoprolinase family protein [Acidobacteriia bacterium]|nr:hydantoinase/oxoprolinase family protein [Terriglobia bacterium]
MRIAIDTGGTFTDCVYVAADGLRVLKLFSTPHDPGTAILDALRQIAPGPGAEIRHGTTVGTNTLIERSGARVAFVTTAGFEDTIAIGRQARPRLYDWLATPDEPLAGAEMRFGVAERTLHDGEILKAVAAEEVERVVEELRAAKPEAVALSLLFSFANAENERAVAAGLERLGVPVSVSHEILPEFREYERASTVLVNAYLAPKMGRYIGALERAVKEEFREARLQVMQSSGGIVSAGVAAREPVRTILSGPAGGVVGAYAVARAAGFPRMVGFDMGGTSTDVALVDGTAGGPRTTSESQVTGLPVGVPVLDIHTVGAGGGSLARFDAGGILRVGPQSAGAEPGPICYGRGSEPTVTDANLLLGRMDPEGFLGGKVRLEEKRAREFFEKKKGPLASVEEFAEGIIRLADATMEKALRLISVERGHDPRDFTLVSFGGAGPLHACALARALRMPRVLVPRMPGALSALGILMSDVVKDYSRTVMAGPEMERLEGHFEEMERRGAREMRAEGFLSSGMAVRSMDVRYVGQGYELNVAAGRDFVAQFHRAHRLRYGYADEARAVEVVNVRVRMVAPTESVELPARRLRAGNGRQAVRKKRRVIFEGRQASVPVLERELLRAGDAFRGPAVITEYSATTAVPPGCRVRVDARENLIIEV